MTSEENERESPTLPPRPQKIIQSDSTKILNQSDLSINTTQSNIPPALPLRHSKVFIGLSNLVKPGKFTETLGAVENFFFHEKRCKHAYAIIAWYDKGYYRYEIDIKSDGTKVTNTIVTQLKGFEDVSVYDFCDQWEIQHPEHQITYIGETTKNFDFLQDYCEKWASAHPTYNAAWDNCRTFVDSMIETIVDKNQVWKTKVVKHSSSTFVVPSKGGFPTPLEYINWKMKQNYKLKRKPTKFKTKINDEGKITVLISEEDHAAIESEADDAKHLISDVASVSLSDVNDNNKGRDWKEYDLNVPVLNIVMLIVGSRGDVQPFVALGKELEKFGHRVRLATHEIFREFVTENGLEFFPLAGNPHELMEYMVKNPGLLPGMLSIRKGDISKKRDTIKEILETSWLACINPSANGEAFKAQAIIANPPNFAHLHCAEKLSIPLHIYFTMPWSPTKAFPHPLINMEYKNKQSENFLNLLSYEITETLTWTGLGEIINDFRKKTLGLNSILSTDAPSVMDDLKIPHTYCWSENLIKKPVDWGDHIDISGFFFLDLATNYNPPQDLLDFLTSGSQPVYIGFGSIVIDDPDNLTSIIFDAVKKAGVRAIVSKGWGGLGGKEIPNEIYMIGNCPHDWLFEHVSAVVHHGGAGTTAAGLSKGKPTTGPYPIPFKKLTSDKLAEALKFSVLEETKERAIKLGAEIKKENGVLLGVRSFHHQLPLSTDIILSNVAAQILIEANRISEKDLSQYRHVKYLTQHINKNVREGIVYGSYSLVVDSIKGVTTFFLDNKNGLSSAMRAERKRDMVHEISKGFAHSIGSAIYYPTKGAGKFLGKMGDGFRNAPAFYDDTERPQERKEVDNFNQGLMAGTKSLAVGIGEGIADFFVKPTKGMQQSGIKGFGKGFAQGTTSLVCKPIAGTLDFIYQGGKGTFRSAKKISKSLSNQSLKNQTENSSLNTIKSEEQFPNELKNFIIEKYDKIIKHGKNLYD
ncbi:hypothetical protein HK099_005431 [Clydaea vesicula]|uniref:Glycosyltransferase family 28 N-terminal domain-containing protein n=1 Tax=Clydaea vesicula TaxID=447962 RepID=A0AAD5TZF2_9FUNG|nr:hypothetical protein HK099_005431 [Clydaea vesicula]